ncbi:MAG: MBL fold metallo-hydrolase [Acidimicrobiales bacterium]
MDRPVYAGRRAGARYPPAGTVVGMYIEHLSLWLAETNCWIVVPGWSSSGPRGGPTGGPARECVLVDVPPGPAAVIARLDRLGLRAVAILITHGHADHIGGVPTLARHGSGPIGAHIHHDDRHMLEDPVGSNGAFGALLEAEGLDLAPPEIITEVSDGERVGWAGAGFAVVHTPGHTPGSTCFLLEQPGEPGVLFSGDHLFAGSIGRTDLPGGSLDALLASMARKILPLPDDVQVLPGHGPRTTIGTERRANPFLSGL